MIFKTTSGQRANITPKQRAQQGIYRIIILAGVILLVLLI